MYTRRSNANGSQFNLPHGTKNILETKNRKKNKTKKPVSMLVKNQTFTATLLVASDSDDKVD